MAQYLQEPSKNGAERLIRNAVEVCDFALSRPAIGEHLTETAWPSGKARVGSTLMLFVEEGLAKVCLHDREAGRTAWASGLSLTKALDALEAALEAGSVEWRRDKVFSRK